MAKDSKATDWTADDQTQLHDATQELYDSLSQAYWAANTMRDKDYIRGLADVAFDILTDLNRQAIAAQTPEFESLSGAVKDIMPRLAKAKEEIDRIIQAVKTAAQVVNAIEKVVAAAAKLLA